MKFKQLFVLLFVFAPLSTQAFSKNERWFDIEVILFSQLAEKKQLNENFTQAKPLPRYKKINDLLTRYLQPDITSLKNLLPICGMQATPKQFSIGSAITTLELPESKLAKQFIEDAKITLLVNAAEKAFAVNDSVNFDKINLEENKYAVTLHKKLCRLSPQTLEELAAADSSFNANAIVIDNIPNKINAVENLYSKQPYLLSQESLTLHDIYKKLKSSREFKPLLHLGWRQPAVSKKSAVPMRLFAGENIKNHHQALLAQFLKQQEIEAEKESILQNILVSEENSITIHSSNKQDELIQKEVLQTIIKQLKSSNNDADQQYQTLAPLAVILDNKNEEVQAPIAPDQNWTIDGFFNVHLNHYLYITADFLVAEKSLAALNSQYLISGEPTNVRSIRFEQNRRVISQEIHYFDHPYMGMIVQIRRHERPEAETQ